MTTTYKGYEITTDDDAVQSLTAEQRAVYNEALAAGASPEDALDAVEMTGA